MVLISLLPIGLMQTCASVEHGMWYARSAEFLKQDIVQTFHWIRIIGDTIFAIGAFALGWFILGLKTGWSIKKEANSLNQSTENYDPEKDDTVLT